MQLDYRAICLDLFGTDDIKKLRAIAEKIGPKNSRNAGRKKKFTEADIDGMRKLQADGRPISEIARMYGTSRQTASRYLNGPPKDGCTLRMTYMYQKRTCTVIDVDFLRQEIYIQNKTPDMIQRAFGANEHPTWQDFDQFLRDRCFPETRGMLKDELARLGLESYDPLQIVERTHGRTAEDNMWLKFQYYGRAAHAED